MKNDPNNSSSELFQNNVLESNLGESFVILDDIEGNRSFDLNETTPVPPIINKPGGAITNTDIRLDDIQFPTKHLSPQFRTHILSWVGSLQSQSDGKVLLGEHNVETFSPRLTEGSLTWNESSQFGESIRSLGQSVLSTAAHDELLNSTFQKIHNTEVKSHSDGVLRLLQVVKTLSKTYITEKSFRFQNSRMNIRRRRK